MRSAAEILTTGRTADRDLLALAASKGGMSATLDRRPASLAVIDGANGLPLVGA